MFHPKQQEHKNKHLAVSQREPLNTEGRVPNETSTDKTTKSNLFTVRDETTKCRICVPIIERSDVIGQPITPGSVETVLRHLMVTDLEHAAFNLDKTAVV